MAIYTRLLKNLGKPYMYGEDVKAVQRKLIELGYLAKNQDDGKYGPITAKAVCAYQKAMGLKCDSIVGPITWGALFPDVVPDGWAKKLCDYVDKMVQLGSIYVLGGQGETGAQITEKWIKKREHNVVTNYTRAINLWKTRLVNGFTNLCAFDCSGLIVKFLMDNGLLKIDQTASGLYHNQCHVIDLQSLEAGCLVFRRNSSGRIHHVGVYMGDGTVIHAKGRNYGVVRETFKSSQWNRYGKLKAFA